MLLAFFYNVESSAKYNIWRTIPLIILSATLVYLTTKKKIYPLKAIFFVYQDNNNTGAWVLLLLPCVYFFLTALSSPCNCINITFTSKSEQTSVLQCWEHATLNSEEKDKEPVCNSVIYWFDKYVKDNRIKKSEVIFHLNESVPQLRNHKSQFCFKKFIYLYENAYINIYI